MKYDIVYCCPEIQSSKISNRPHAGISYLSAYLKHKHREVLYFRHRNLKTIFEYVEELSSLNTLIYGFSATDDTLDIVLAIAERLKCCRPDAFILVGGALGKEEVAEYLLNFTFIDGVAIGEGEYSTDHLISCLQNGGLLNDIPGIVTSNSLGYHKKIATVPVDINSYPSPILSGLVPDSDLAEQGLISSRGCVHRCIYCSFSTVSNWKVRFYEETRFLEEVKYIVSHLKDSNTDYEIPIWDDTFSFNLSRAKRLLRGISEINHYGQKFWLQTRIDYIDEEFIYLAKLAGISHIGIGLESASTKVLKIAKKVRLSNFDEPGYGPEERYLEQFFHVVNWCRKYDINYTINTIFGLPGETFDDALKTVKLIEKTHPQFYFHAFVRLYTGVPLARNYYKYGYQVHAPNLLDGAQRPPVNAQIKEYNYDIHSVPKLPYRQQKLDLVAITGFVHDTAEASQNVTISSDLKLEESFLNHPIFKNRTCLVKQSTSLNDFAKKNNYYSTDVFTGVTPQLLFETITVKLSDLSNFFHISIEQFNKESYKRYSIYADTHLEISIESEADYEIASFISELLQNGGELILPDNLTSMQFGLAFLQDSCRWNSYCSAYDDMRCYINGVGDILSCEKGCKIQEYHVISSDSFHESFIQQYQRTVHERKCADCSAKDICSKCLAIPDSFIQHYCSIQKAKHKLSTLIRTVDYTVKQIMNPLDLGTFKTTGNSIYFPENCNDSCLAFIISIDKSNYYVLNNKSIQIRKLGVDLSNAIKEYWKNGNVNSFLTKARKINLDESEIQSTVELIKRLDMMRYI